MSSVTGDTRCAYVGWRTGVEGQPLSRLPLLPLPRCFLLAVSHTYPFCQEHDGQPGAEDGAQMEVQLFQKLGSAGSWHVPL